MRKASDSKPWAALPCLSSSARILGLGDHSSSAGGNLGLWCRSCIFGMTQTLDFQDVVCSMHSELFFFLIFQIWLYFLFPFLKLIYFNWRIITLQYCDGLCHTSTWIGHRHIRVPSPLNPSPTFLPVPSFQVVTEHRLWVPCVIHQTLRGYLFYIS